MIEYENTLVCIDPSLPTLSLIGKKYTMMIIGVIGNKGEVKNFNEVLNDIPFSSSTIIAKRLKELQIFGLVDRGERNGKVVYSLTKLGKAIRNALFPLMKALESQLIYKKD